MKNTKNTLNNTKSCDGKRSVSSHAGKTIVIFMEDHIPVRSDRSLLLGRPKVDRLLNKWPLWDVVFHEYNSN